jgi:hypothetical protein
MTARETRLEAALVANAALRIQAAATIKPHEVNKRGDRPVTTRWPAKAKPILRTARDRLIPDTPDFSVPASRACPLTERDREHQWLRPRTTSRSTTRSCR